MQKKRQVGNDNCVSHCTLKLQIPESPCVRTSFQGAGQGPCLSGSHAVFNGPRCTGRLSHPLIFSKARMQPRVGAFLDKSPMTSLDGLIHGSNCRERAEANSKALSARTASGSKSLESRPFSK